jgi:RNA polymerase sigma-70 factor (ECF subfamily)
VSLESDSSSRPSERDESFDKRDRLDMERLASGHDAALNDLMERHAAKLFNYLLRCLQNEEDAADAAQETFVRVYQNRAKFDTHQRFLTWLYAIATNLVKDRYRYRARHPQLSLDTEPMGHEFQESLPEEKPTPSESSQRTERAAVITALPVRSQIHHSGQRTFDLFH